MPIRIIEINNINGWNPCLQKWGVIVKHGVLIFRNELAFVSQSFGGGPNPICEAWIRITFFIYIQICIPDHIQNDDGSRLNGIILHEFTGTQNPIPAWGVAIIFRVKKNKPDWNRIFG